MAAQTADQVARLHHVESVMERLGLGRSKVFELMATNELRSVKVGRRRLVSESAIVDFISRLEAGADEPRGAESGEPRGVGAA